MLEFENAHCHTYMSNPLTLPDSTVSIFDYAKVYQERGMQCVVASEHGYRGDVWAQADAAKKYSTEQFRMKAICAAEAYFVPDRNPELKDGRNFHLLLIAKNMEGFYELNEILSESQVSGYYKVGRLDFDLLSRLDHRHFLCTTACVGGVLRDPEGEKYACALHDIFRENFRLEVQYHLIEDQIRHNEWVLSLYKKYGWPLFFATDSHYINKQDKLLRKELQLSSKIDLPDSGWDLYLPTAEEAYDAMLKQGVLSKAQIEEAFENTLELRTFEGFTYDTERKFPVSRKDLSIEQREYLYQKMVCDGYIAKAGMPNAQEKKELRQEMNTILETHSCDYFIGLHDMLERGQQLGGILTTTSRGSACGFATNYALGFTSINRLHSPVRMYPERFISKAKLLSGSMPDIDSNISNLEAFEQAGREIFGEHSCYPMVAYGKTKALSAFKLLARARELDFETSNIVSKQIQNYELDRKHAIENNQDDPDYNVDDDIHIEDYVDQKYISLIEDSKQYRNIVVSLSPHPCGHIVYHEDLRRLIGIVRTKAKTGSKEAVYCAYIDGVTADKAGWCKSDLLRVDVVKVINDTFHMLGKPVLSADELLAEVDKHPEVWDLYAKGYTMGLNQCEKPKTTERVMQFKPRNTVELAAFVAAIRPGAKSLVDDFVARRFHNYGIPAMDDLLKLYGATGTTGESSFLFYDEQIMTLAKAAGIDPADANALIKHIKKKHLADVASYKERFIPGFINYLETEQHVEPALAERTAQDVWSVIINSASYLFNASHAYAYCIDSLYGAYLKYIAPYEFYTTLLKLYTDKGNKEKIALIVNEMKRYQNIQMTPGKFGQDNRDWYIDKEQKTISQSLSSIKFMSQLAADDLFTLGQRTFDSFTSLLRALQMETCVKKNQIELLIRLGYFSDFGGSKKLLQIFNEFNDGKNRLTKTLSEKSVTARTQTLVEMESTLENEDLPIVEQLRAEQDFMCICLSCDPFSDSNLYFVQEIDDQYGIKIKLYNLRRGKSGVAKVRKDLFKSKPLSAGQIMCLDGWKEQRRCSYKDGQRIELDVKDIWATSYHILKEV